MRPARIGLLACAFIACSATAAHAFPPGPRGVPHVSCTKIDIDPPTWIKVRFTGTIGGQVVDRTAFYAYDIKVEELLQEMSDDEVLKLQRSFAKLTQTNCWYATYNARPHVLECISRELNRRSQLEAERSRELEKENQ